MPDSKHASAGSQQEWFCPRCGMRLSYGVYCKTCQVETAFAVRPATEIDRLRARLRATPAPSYPEYVGDDYSPADRLAAIIGEPVTPVELSGYEITGMITALEGATS